MIDSRTAAHTAIYTALAAEDAVTDLADVWGHAEEGTEPTETKGLVLLGLASASNMAGKDGGLDDVTIEVLATIRKPDPTVLYTLSAAVRNALEGKHVTASGAEVSPPEFLSADADLMDDGETYFDTLRFRMIVQPA
jgi:hypothetical protein